MFRYAVVAAVVAAVLVPSALAADQNDRVSASEKGSLLIYPKVEVRWDAAGNLTQDTFITICNDWNADVDVMMYFVSETCTDIDNMITLTSNEPAYWSVASGLPKGVSPWTALGEPYDDPEGSGALIMRGYIVAWAINEDYEQISWNHLYGGATIVDYLNGAAWEYTAYAFQALNVDHGDVVGTPGTLELNGGGMNGDEPAYDQGFQILLLDFFASGTHAFSASSPGPRETITRFDIWNEDEHGFSGARWDFIKWTEVLLGDIHPHFLVVNLQSDMGRARISGTEDGDTINESLLGVAAKILTFDGAEVGYSGKPLTGAGAMAATIKYDVLEPPPTFPLNLWNMKVAPGALTR
jgi:hypothetical protein